MSQLDEKDRAILAELVEDADQSARTLSNKLKIHPNTLVQRISKLKKNKILLKQLAVVDYDKLGYGLQALVFINVKMSKDWEIKLKPIAALPEIYSFFLLTGDYDALAIVRIRNKTELSDLLRKLQATDIVVKTTTHLILDHYKHSYEYNPLKSELRL